MKSNPIIDLFDSKVKEYKENFIRDIKNEISELEKELKEKNLNQTIDKAKRKILEDLVREKKKYLQLWVVYNEELSRHYLMHYIGFIDNYFFLGNSDFFKAVNPDEVLPPVNVKSKREINDLEMESILRFLEEAVTTNRSLYQLVIPDGFFVFDYEFYGKRSSDDYESRMGRRLFKAENIEEAFGMFQTAIVFAGESWFEWVRVYFDNKWWKMTPKDGKKKWKNLHNRKFQEFVLEQII